MSTPVAKHRWQQSVQASPKTRRYRVISGIVLLTLAVAATLFWISKWLPTSKPLAYFRVMYVPYYDKFDVQARYSSIDIGRLESLLNSSDDDRAIFSAVKIQSNQVTNIFDQTRQELEKCKQHDVAIFYIAAHGICDNQGAPCLLTPDSGPHDSGSYSSTELKPLLDQIHLLKVSNKLLLLDAGQLNTDFERGMAINGFLFALHQLIKTKEFNDEDLWVICSHSLFQISHLSESRGGSIFGDAVVEAMKEFRDSKQPDKPISVEAFYSSICRHCQLATGSNPTYQQTPVLMRGGKGIVFEQDRSQQGLGLDKLVIYGSQIPDQNSSPASAGPVDALADQTESTGSAEESTVALKDTETVQDGHSQQDSESAGANAGAGLLPDSPASPLAMAWKSRDELQSRRYGFSPVDFAPHLWVRINDELIALQRHRRVHRQPAEASDLDGDIARIGAELDALLRLMSPSASEASDVGLDSERLNRAWQQFHGEFLLNFNRPENSAFVTQIEQIEMNARVFRDISYRSRYYTRWFEHASLVDAREFAEPIKKLLTELKNKQEQFSPPRTKYDVSTDTAALAEAIRPVIEAELAILRLWKRRIEGIRKTTNLSFNDEYFLIGLLDSPIIGMDSFFGYGEQPENAKNDILKKFMDLDKNSIFPTRAWLSRNELDQLWQQSKVKPPNPENATGTSWATHLWSGTAREQVEIQKARLDIYRSYLGLGQSLEAIHLENYIIYPEPQLPADVSVADWEEMVASYLQSYADVAAKVKEDLNNVADRPQQWIAAIIMSDRSIRAANNDHDFVTPPLEFTWPDETVIVKFDWEQMNQSTNQINLDMEVAPSLKIVMSSSGFNAEAHQVGLVIRLADDTPQQKADKEQFLKKLEAELVIKRGEKEIFLDQPFQIELAKNEHEEKETTAETTLNFSSRLRDESLFGKRFQLELKFADQQDPQTKIEGSRGSGFTCQMPRGDDLRLLVRAFGSEDVSARSSKASDPVYVDWMLRPFVNQDRAYEFGIRNDSGKTKTFALEIYPVKIPDENSPSQQLRPGRFLGYDDTQPSKAIEEATIQTAEQSASAIAVGKDRIKLASGESGWFTLTKPEIQKPATANGAPGESAAAAQSTASDEKKKQQDASVTHGMFCRLKETIDGDLTNSEKVREFWIQLAPFDTRQFFAIRPDKTLTNAPERAWCRFDPQAETLSVELLLDPQMAQSAGALNCSIRTNQGDEIKFNSSKFKLGLDEISTIVFEAPISANQLADSILISVDVNDEPGVFYYELNEDNKATQYLPNIRDAKNILALTQITASYPDPKQVKNEKPRTDRFIDLQPPDRLSFEIWASFTEERAAKSILNFQFGQQDNRTVNEVTLTDRSITFPCKLDDDGKLNLRASISNHPFQVDTHNYQAGSWVMKAFISSDGNQNDNLVEQTFRFDKDPPTGKMVLSEQEVDSDQEFVDVEITADDAVGVSKIDLFVDANSNGKIDDGEKRIAGWDAVSDISQEDNTWEIKIPVKKVAAEQEFNAKQYQLLASLTDRVGNVTDPTKSLAANALLTIIKRKPVVQNADKTNSTPPPPKTSKVLIRTVWKADKNDPISVNYLRFKNQIFTPTRLSGNTFEFEIPPDKYLIFAEGMSPAGRYSHSIQGHLEIEVGDKPTYEFTMELSRDGTLEPKKDSPDGPQKK